MTLILKGRFWLGLLTQPSTSDVGREVGQFGPRCNLEAIVLQSDSHDAFLEAGKKSRGEVAVILNRVPAGLDAAHVGFVFTDVVGSGHCGAPVHSSHR